MKSLLRLLTKCLILLGCNAAFSQAPGLSGTLIVLNKAANDASFIDLASGRLLATLPTGTDPHELIVSRDGRWAIGTNYRGGDSLTVFDLRNLAVARTVDLAAHPSPHGILLMPGDRQVAVTTQGSNELLIIDFMTGEIIRAIDTAAPGSHMVALAADASVAYTANTQGDSVSVLDPVAGRTLRTLEVPAQPEAITTNRAGSEIWVGSNQQGVVSVVDPASGRVLRQLTGFSWPYRIMLTRDEQSVLIPDARAQALRVFDRASGAERGSLDLAGAGPQGVALHPDDRTLFLALSRQRKVLAIDIESLEVLGEYAAGEGPDGVGYSPLTH